jgi:hypothetical protein
VRRTIALLLLLAGGLFTVLGWCWLESLYIAHRIVGGINVSWDNRAARTLAGMWECSAMETSLGIFTTVAGWALVVGTIVWVTGLWSEIRSGAIGRNTCEEC